MIDHKCKYAALIGRDPAWQTDEDGLTVCVWCHEPKSKPVAKAAATKTVRK
jgi:hypothetical protein